MEAHPPGMATAQSTIFGTLLRRYRGLAGLTQEALAERAHLSVRAISDLERGVNQTPRADTIQLLARALQLAPSERADFEAAAGRRTVAGIGPGRPALPAGSAGSAAGRTPLGIQGGVSAGSGLPPFVGRTRELALLERHLGGEGPPVLLLVGEPGIGKSRLLQQAVQQAPSRGWRVLVGGCQRRGGQEPYAPLLGALQRYIGSQGLVDLRANLHGCAWLVRLLPELAEGPIAPLPAWTLPPAQERRLIFEAVARFLANVAGPAGTLLLLDDLQWAAGDALDLLVTLVRSAATGSVRVVGAYRDTEVGTQDALSNTLADLAQAGLATHCALGPLPLPEARQLLDGLLAGWEEDQTALRARVLQRAGGVPFVVVSSAQWLRRGAGAAGGEEAVPWDVAQGIRQRVAALPEGARQVLGVAAVVGRVVSRPLLARVVARPEEEVLAALEAACRARLLEEQGETAYQFAHDAIREVVEADLGAARRTALHRRVAEALDQGPGEAPVELLAYHYARSDAQDQALRYLEQAGDQAQAQFAHAAAATYYGDLVERLDGLGRALDAARAREKLGTSLFLAARLEAALEVLEWAARTWQAAGEQEGLRRTLAQIGRLHALRDTTEEGLARLEPLLPAGAGSTPSPGLAALYAALTWLHMSALRWAESVALAERAAELARAVGDDRILADVEVRHGTALIGMGRTQEARQVLEGALPVVEAVGGAYEPLVRLYNNLGGLYKYQGQFDQSRRYYERALALTEQVGDAFGRQLALARLGDVMYLRGDWAAADAHVRVAMHVMRSVGWSLAAVAPLESLVQLRLARGEWAEASRCLEEGVAMAPPRSVNLQMWAGFPRLLAERALLEGKPDAALAHLAPYRDDQPAGELDRTLHLPTMAWAHLERGEDLVAARLVETAVQRAQVQTNRLALVDALRVQALVAARQQCWAEAERALEEGLALAQSMPYPYMEGRLLHVYGLLHVQKGEPGPARERLEAALSIFRRLGARKDAERVEQALAMLSRNRTARPFEMRVSDAQWARIQALLPPRAPTGRPRADDRLTLEAILYVRRRGCAWAALPAALGAGATAHRRWRQWQAAGLWARIEAILGARSARGGPDQLATTQAEPREEAD